jgi:hypothetical protein
MLLPVSAVASGGPTIASAPVLPVGHLVASGWVESSSPDNVSLGEFWRVQLNAGDQLTIDGTVTQSCGSAGGSVEVDVYAPSVTDSTVANAPSAATGEFDPKGEFVFVAPSTGAWTIFVHRGCSSVSYDFTAQITPFSGTPSGNGGATIASAPALPVGHLVASGWVESSSPDNVSLGEFWRVQLSAGDQLTIDGNVAQSCGSAGGSVEVDVYAPSVTDSTVANTDSAATGEFDPKGEFVFVAPSTGAWTIFVHRGCTSVSYDFTAQIAPFTGMSSGNGGATIATAPSLPLAQKHASGWVESSSPDNVSFGEFWRVQLNAGDHLIINATVTESCGGPGGSLDVDVYAPSVTDYTIGHTDSVKSGEFDPNGQFVFVAPSTGDWTIFFNRGCGSLAYDFTAFAKAPTHAVLTGPARVPAHRTVTLTGRISGISSGTVAIQVQVGRHWRTLGKVPVRPSGRFKFAARVGERHHYLYRAVYSGDTTHVASRAMFTVTVR